MSSAGQGNRMAKKPKLPYRRAQTYAADLTPEQEQAFDVLAAGVRWAWNQWSASQGALWKAHELLETTSELGKKITAARQGHEMFRYYTTSCLFTEHSFAEIPHTCLSSALRQFTDAWTRHFKALKTGAPSSPPGFRSWKGPQSLYWEVQQDDHSCSPGDVLPITRGSAVRSTPHTAMLRVPTALGSAICIGKVSVRLHRLLPDDARVNFAVLRRDKIGRYAVTVQYQTATVRQGAATGLTGVDRGSVVTAATSSGEFYNAPGLTPGQLKRKLRLEQGLAHKRLANKCIHDEEITVGGKIWVKRGDCPEPGDPGHDCRCWKHTRSYKDQQLALAKLSVREQRMRKAVSHMASRALADRYAVVVMEDLKLSAMTRRAHGPGSAGKTGRNREMRAASLYQLQKLTEYKTTVVYVPPPYTSQTCPACGHVDKKNRDEQVFCCTSCGLSGHADVIAARNIENLYERPGDDSDPGGRSHAGQDREIVRTLGENLIPAAWGRPVARTRRRKAWSKRVKKPSPGDSL